MPRHLSLAAGLALGVMSLAACGEDTPTQPSSPADPSLTPPFLATASNSWTPIAPMPCCDGAWVSVGAVPNAAGQSIAYVFGGTNANGHTGSPVRAYNVATNTWSVKTGDIHAFDGNGVGVIGGKLYFTGGYGEHNVLESASPYLWVYDPVTDVLSQKANPPLRTAEGVTGVIGDKLYVLPGRCAAIGLVLKGYCNQEEFIRKLFRYNPATDIWVTKAPPPHFHKNGAGGVIDNKFYVVGGEDDRLNETRNLDVYDPVTNTWKSLAPMPAAFRYLTGTALRGLLVVAGVTFETGSASYRTYAYNPTSNKWNSKAPRSSAAGSAAKVFLNGTSRMLVVSGPVVDGPSTSELYTP
jgi:N-acetylneuraminic acid mutarotase